MSTTKKAPRYRVFKSGGVWHATTNNHEGSKADAYTKTGKTPVEALSALVAQEESDLQEINAALSISGVSL